MTEVPRDVVQAELDAWGDPGLESMLRKGMPLTREDYIAHSFGGDIPEEWTAEHEMSLPECFRDPDALPKMRMRGLEED